MSQEDETSGATGSKAVDGSNNFGPDFKSQLLCKRSRDGVDAFSLNALIENAAMAVGGYFLGKKVLGPKVRFAGFLTGKRFAN